jgi:hypothetical protein
MFREQLFVERGANAQLGQASKARHIDCTDYVNG